MYERILLPTDGSEGTKQAVEHAIDIAGTYGATLYVLSVIDTNEFQALEGIDASQIKDRRQAAIEAVADRAAEEGVDVQTTIREGAPDQEILSYTDEHDVDLIVMGTRGRSGIDRVLLGSVTESVVRQANVPVVTVRMSADATSVRSAETAAEIALDALEADGHDGAALVEDPHRTSGSWIVPARTDEGTYHVHVDAADGETRIARLDG